MKKKGFNTLLLGIVVVMLLYFILQVLFVPDGLFILIAIPFHLLSITINSKFTIFSSKKVKNVVSLVAIHVSLLTTFFATSFVNAIAHGGALLSISIGTQLFIITSYTVAAITTSMLSFISFRVAMNDITAKAICTGAGSD